MSDDRKKLLNEILPTPQPTERASPRERTTAHWKRLIAAAVTALPFSALADNSVPGDQTKDPKKGGETTPAKPPDKPPPDVGYGVVDPMPEPYVNRTGQTGTLRIDSKPAGATVLVDGADIGMKTPVTNYKLGVGMHAISVTSADGNTTQNLTVDVKAGAKIKKSFDLRPKKPKK